MVWRVRGYSGHIPKVMHELELERKVRRFIREQELGLISFLAEVITYVKTSRYEKE